MAVNDQSKACRWRPVGSQLRSRGKAIWRYNFRQFLSFGDCSTYFRLLIALGEAAPRFAHSPPDVFVIDSWMKPMVELIEIAA